MIKKRPSVPPLLLLVLSFVSSVVVAQVATKPAGGPAEPVRYIGNEQANALHGGGLRLAVGVKSWQAFRANRAHPERAEGFGWTYNHAPMLAYWNDRFYIEYLSDGTSENKDPGHTLMMSSTDGVHWEKPQVVFPLYRIPDRVDFQTPSVVSPTYGRAGGTLLQMHQRMGFYVAPDERLLIIGFYGLPNRPFDGRGIGRVLREVHRDGSLGPIYFVRFNRQNGWNEENTNYPFYEQSPDEGFKQACRALLADQLATLQWWEEERANPDLYPDFDGKVLQALSAYHRVDGTTVGLWKGAWTALSSNDGRTWSDPVQAPTLAMAHAKVWGQRTPDGRYALLYNPRRDNRHRWPLAIVTGDDGIHFDNLLTVQGEVPPRRYNGVGKAFGPQYVRGISEGNGAPSGNGFWVTYSMNKEDIWVSRIPTPVRAAVAEPVRDTFDASSFEDLPWNTYSPRWAPVALVDLPGEPTGRSLELRDRDPADYARATRIFPAMKKGSVRFKVRPAQSDHGRLEIEIFDHSGNRPPISMFLDKQARIRALDVERMDIQTLTHYAANVWYDVIIRFDLETELFDIIVNNRPLLLGAEISFPADSLERLSFRTGPYRASPTLRDPKAPSENFSHADEPEPEAAYDIDDVFVTPGDW